MSTATCSCGERRKIFCEYPLLSGAPNEGPSQCSKHTIQIGNVRSSQKLVDRINNTRLKGLAVL